MKNLLLSSALALSAVMAPTAASAEHRDGTQVITTHRDYDRDRNKPRVRISVIPQIVLGTPSYNTYGYGNTYGNAYGYGNQYGYTGNYGAYGAFGQDRDQCGFGFNRTSIYVNNLRTNSGSFVVSERNRVGFRLTGSRYAARNMICVNDNDLRFGRTATIVHDVNNNGIFDRWDGIGRISLNNRVAYGYGEEYGYGNAYGAMRPETVTLRYGF